MSDEATKLISDMTWPEVKEARVDFVVVFNDCIEGIVSMEKSKYESFLSELVSRMEGSGEFYTHMEATNVAELGAEILSTYDFATENAKDAEIAELKRLMAAYAKHVEHLEGSDCIFPSELLLSVDADAVQKIVEESK